MNEIRLIVLDSFIRARGHHCAWTAKRSVPRSAPSESNCPPSSATPFEEIKS